MAKTTYVVFLYEKLPTFHGKSSVNDQRIKVKKIAKRFTFGAWGRGGGRGRGYGVSHKQTPVQTTFWQTVGACHNNYKCESLSFQIFIIFLVQTALFSYIQFQYFIQVFVYGFVISIGYKILADC